jgi:hypothetical protein
MAKTIMNQKERLRYSLNVTKIRTIISKVLYSASPLGKAVIIFRSSELPVYPAGSFYSEVHMHARSSMTPAPA